MSIDSHGRRNVLRVFAVIAKIVVSGGLVWFAFSKIDLKSAWQTLLSISPAALVAAAFLMFVQYMLAAFRLRALLEALGATYCFRSALGVVMIGAFFSQTLISFVGGDAMRIWRIIRSNISVAVAAKSVVFDRIAGFAGLFILLLVATPLLTKIIRSPEMLVGQVLIVLVALGGIVGALLLRRLRDLLPSWKVVKVAVGVVDSGLQIWRSKHGAWIVLGLSLGVQILNVLILYVLGKGLGIDLTFIDGLLLFPTVLFLSMLPISVAGWGVREGAMIAGLALVGVPAHQSLALSVCFGLSLIAISIPGGIVWLAGRHAPMAHASK